MINRRRAAEKELFALSLLDLTPIPPLLGDGDPGVFVEGTHLPLPLVTQSGVWLHSAGSAMLQQNAYTLGRIPQWLWMIVDEGRIAFEADELTFELQKGECVVIPPSVPNCALRQARDARILWFTLDGPLSGDFLQQMNALSTAPAKQGVLPSQVLLTRQIVQVLVRHTDSGDASFQLSQLLWSLIAAHAGQAVAMSATLSHEIARVVDALRASRFRENLSLADMAAISRMPVETFRKRFSSELGIPPLGYLQFLKMERAKALLRTGLSVKETGAEIGMSDPYHFSKQFKHVVGMSPTAYLKHVGAAPSRGRS